MDGTNTSASISTSKSSRISMYKGLWGLILVLGFVWLLLFGVLENKGTNILKKQRPNFMSLKRRVPNGPDPIHNRREGNSHQPHGQVSKGELGKP